MRFLRCLEMPINTGFACKKGTVLTVPFLQVKPCRIRKPRSPCSGATRIRTWKMTESESEGRNPCIAHDYRLIVLWLIKLLPMNLLITSPLFRVTRKSIMSSEEYNMSGCLIAYDTIQIFVVVITRRHISNNLISFYIIIQHFFQER